MADRRLRTSAVMALLLPALGVIVPIVWDYYKTKSAIELRTLSTTSIVDGPQGLAKLRIEYGGKSIANISRVEFALANTGRTPIREGDLVVPPHIDFSHRTELLDVQPLTSIPQDLIFSTQLDTLQRKLSIRFPLLNPHDEIRFSILVSSWDPAFRASARIAGVRELGVTQASASARSKALHLPWTVYFVATITTICLLLLLFGFLHWGIEIALRNTHVMGILSIPQGHTAQELQTKLSGFFMPTKSAREMEPVLGYLRGFPPDHVLIPLEHQQMNVQLGRALENVRSTKYSLILLALVSILGLAYVLRAVYG